MKNDLKPITRNEIDRKWNPFKGILQRKALSISSKLFQILDLDPNDDTLGCTLNGDKIYLNNNHELTKELDKNRFFMFYEGVFAHELMHQLNTDFSVDRMFEKVSKEDAGFLYTLFNIIEDPAIEHFAHCFFGGRILHSLYFSVNYTYNKSPEITPDQPTLGQYINALIQFGDGGYIKGELSDEAQKYFDETIGLVWNAINEPNSTKRADYAIEIYNIIKPLVEQERNEMDELLKQMQKSGKSQVSSQSGGRSGYQFDPDNFEESEDGENSDEWQSQKSQNQENIAKGNNKQNSKSNGDEQDNDDSENGSGKSGKEQKDSNDGQDSNSGNQNENGDQNGNDSKNGQNGDKQNSSSNSNDNSENGKNNSSNKSNNTQNGDNNKPGEYEISADDIKSLEGEIQKSLDKEKSEAKRTSKANDKKELELPNVKELRSLASIFAGVRCENKFPGRNSRDEEGIYNAYLRDVSSGISSLTKGLKRILQKKQDEITYANSGRVSIKRLQTISGDRMTTRVFSKRKDAANKFDTAIMVVLDVSGSMGGSSETQAIKTAIGLCEVCNNLHIPIKLMTFSGEKGNYNANHTHYVNWENTKADRTKLINIRAYGLTFMSYALYYAGKMLAARPEHNKIMMVITDGQPCDHFHRSEGESVRVSQLAVKEIKKFASIIALGIGGAEDTLLSIFKNDFVQKDDINQMFNMLGNKLKGEVKKW